MSWSSLVYLSVGKILNLRDLKSKSTNSSDIIIEHCARAEHQLFLGHGLYTCITAPLLPVRSIPICTSHMVL